MLSDKQLKGTFELLNSKYSSKETIDNEDDEESDEEKKDGDQTELDDTLIKMDEETGNPSLSRKNKKKIKIFKESPEDQQINLAGPIKVEIDLTADMAKRLSNSIQPQKIKLENRSENQGPAETKNQDAMANLKLENGGMEFETLQPKVESIAHVAEMERLQQHLQNNNPFHNPLNNMGGSLPFLANGMGDTGLMNNALGGNGFGANGLEFNALGNNGLNNGITNNNNFGLFQSMQDRFLKSMQYYMNPQMNFFNMMENNPFANPYLYQECMKTYMENMKKNYDNNTKK